jgi:hypothetical protein
MPDASLLPLVAPLADPRRPDPPAARTPESAQDTAPRIVPAFRFVPESAAVIHDPARLARTYARAAREGRG